MGSNNPDNQKTTDTGRYDLDLTMSEAAKGCSKSVSINGQIYTLDIPVGTQVGDTFEVKSGNGFLMGTVKIFRIVPDPVLSTSAAGPKKSSKPWIFIAAGVVAAAVIAVIAFGGDGRPDGSDEAGTAGSEVTYAGITFEVPEGWTENTDWHEQMAAQGRDSWALFPPQEDYRGQGIFVESYTVDHSMEYYELYSEGGLETIKDRKLSTLNRDETCEVLGQGFITLGDTECWYVEYDSNTVIDDTADTEYDNYNYELYIAVSDEQLTEFYFETLKGGTYGEDGSYIENEEYERDMELRDQIISTLRVE